jgi:hypothetical protein
MHNDEDRLGQPHAAAIRLRSTLEHLAGALATVDLDALLASEAELAAALAELGDPRLLEPASRMATTRELRSAKSALTRCRRLGATLSDLTRLTLAARGAGPAYGRRGEPRSDLRVHALEAKV